MGSSSSTPAEVQTEVPKDTRHFTWRIPDFNLIRTSDKLMDSIHLEFEIGTNIGFPVQLQVSLRNCEDNGKRTIGLFFHVKECPKDATEVMFHATIIVVGSSEPRKFDKVYNLLESEGVGFYSIFSPNETISRRLDSDGSLSLGIKVIVYHPGGTRTTLLSIPSLLANFQQRFVQKLRQDMEDLYKYPCQPTTTPPTLIHVISREGRAFPVNWLILAARSPVFRTMFQTSMREVEIGRIKMEDIGGDALEVLLQFMHSATLHDNWKEPGIVEELTQAAHMYLLEDLLEFLDVAIGMVCSPENCAKLLCLAERLGLKKAETALKQKSVGRIAQ